jgi:putative DNA primase/helicase
MSPLGKQAVAYAWLLNWRILPCRPGEKLPIIKEWQERATTDREQIARWWQQWPDANIAVATGPGSRLFVLDVDGVEGERSLVALERQHGDVPETYCQQQTGSGEGWQAFFAWPIDRTIRNSAGKLGAGLDIRGDGGYVVLPPSVHPSGRKYMWALDRSPWELPPEPAPAWLIELLDPPQTEPEPRTESTGQSGGQGERYVLKALEDELALVAAAPSGRRNHQLNASAHALFRFVADNRIDRDVVVRGLEAAAQHAGLHAREALPTIRSAARARGVGL